MAQNIETDKPSKRCRNPKNHKREVMKAKREKGQQYENYKGRIIEAKTFRKVVCKCRMSCHITIPEVDQKHIFDEYWNLSSWTEKTTFLLNNSESSDCKARRKAEKRKNIRFQKSFHREYFFGSKEKKVCKNFFSSVLQVSKSKIDKCIQKKQKNASDCTVDRRGKHKSHKKSPANKIRNIVKFINSLPHYESHYVREANPGRKYLPPNLNLKILYEEYKNMCNEQDESPLSNYMFRDVFYRKFNLRFKAPLQDTCNYCDSMKHKINEAPIKSVQRMELIQLREEHYSGVRLLSQEYKDYVNESKQSTDTIVLVFDLEKIFETPKLPTSRVYYSRQLSTYNLCIHDATHNRSYMYIWHEAIASEGPAEITSCLIHHMNHFIPNECRNLILYSDSCGAQNRNIKTAAMLSHYLEKSEHLVSITQHFYRTGHSYNVCDCKFAIIEKKRKKVDTIYVPSQWKSLIETAKETVPKFNVIEMNSSHFVSCDQLLATFCTNRKKTVDNEDINWFTFRKLGLRKGYPMTIFFETYADVAAKYDESYEFKPDKTKILSVAKKGIQSNNFTQYNMPLLYPEGRPIATKKKSDLLELLELIPAEFRSFYVNLNHTDQAEEIEEPADVVVILDD